MKLFPNRHHEIDPVWHVQVTLVVAILLQFFLPDTFLASSRIVLTAISLLALVSLSITTPHKDVFESPSRRLNVFLLIASIGFTNLYSLLRVLGAMLNGGTFNGHDLILAAINIYLTNIIVFAMLYWEMDGGGPGKRRSPHNDTRDFLFPQDALHGEKHKHWNPTFIDYVYVSSTNATAFSPTDTMPLTRRAKVLMLAQALVSLLTVALIAGRAINILR